MESVFNLLFNDVAGEVPTHQTIFDWLLKYGLSLNLETDSLELCDKSLIIDNSVNMNGQELHLELAAPALHPGHPLTHDDVCLARMTVDTKWDARMMEKQIKKTISKEKPLFTLSDNAKTICNACTELGLKHHRDISHSFGMFLERVYDNTVELSEFNQGMSHARKFSHTEIGCLMPPKRRTYARFMNLFDRIEWAYLAKSNFNRLPKRGKTEFSFVKEQAAFIDEMKDVMDRYRYMEKLVKEKGLSHQTAQECRDYINATFMQETPRLIQLGQMLLDYFDTEESLLEGEDDVHNICSDIIESVFGYTKGRLSSNSNNGFTPLILLIPVHLRVANLDSCKGMNVYTNMEETRLPDVNKWRKKNLMKNPMAKRKKTLKKAS